MWKPLWDGYNAFYGRAGQTALPPEVTQMTWSRFFDAYEPMRALVAEDSGNLLGLAHFLFHRSTIQIAPTCYLQDLFTVEAARAAGAGRALRAGGGAACRQRRCGGVRRGRRAGNGALACGWGAQPALVPAIPITAPCNPFRHV